mmetsp:Transcript_5826/g.8200  ORF Transcript_5826/g.8200 Transcript_5826/m.8200 type:complete len:82 (+) Transcript_5826:1259-1504(+)
MNNNMPLTFYDNNYRKNFSKKFTEAETKYSTYEQELFALATAILHWRTYLEGAFFSVRTDHNPLRFLHSQKEPTTVGGFIH